MNIDELLDQMDEVLEEAFNVPFSGGKRMVDIDKVRDIIDDIRLNMPTEIRQAKAIVNDRADIVSTAKKEAEAIVKRAEERARAAVSQETVVKAAQQRANEIAVAAQTQSREMRTKVTDYCDNLLHKTEEQLARSAGEVKTLRSSLRQPAGRNSAKVTPKPQQNNLP
ncbi:MAG: ATPase [Ruthenibacterium sp.]